jgi:hypothetical protein
MEDYNNLFKWVWESCGGAVYRRWKPKPPPNREENSGEPIEVSVLNVNQVEYSV